MSTVKKNSSISAGVQRYNHCLEEQEIKQHSVDRARDKSINDIHSPPQASPACVVSVNSSICVFTVVFDADMGDDGGAAQPKELGGEVEFLPKYLVL